MEVFFLQKNKKRKRDIGNLNLFLENFYFFKLIFFFSIRKQYREKGEAYLKEKNYKAAKEAFQRAIDISPRIAQNLIDVFKYFILLYCLFFNVYYRN